MSDEKQPSDQISKQTIETQTDVPAAPLPSPNANQSTLDTNNESTDESKTTSEPTENLERRLYTEALQVINGENPKVTYFKEMMKKLEKDPSFNPTIFFDKYVEPGSSLHDITLLGKEMERYINNSLDEGTRENLFKIVAFLLKIAHFTGTSKEEGFWYALQIITSDTPKVKYLQQIIERLVEVDPATSPAKFFGKYEGKYDTRTFLGEAMRRHSHTWLDEETRENLSEEETRENLFEIVKYLLENGVEVNKAIDGLPPLFLAIAYLDPQMVNLLIQHKADVTKTLDSATVLHWIANKDGENALRIMKLCLQQLQVTDQLEKMIDKRDHGSETALWKAVTDRRPNNAFLLLQASANPNKEVSGRTPLFQAGLNGDSKMINLLFQHRATINKKEFNLKSKKGTAVLQAIGAELEKMKKEPSYKQLQFDCGSFYYRLEPYHSLVKQALRARGAPPPPISTTIAQSTSPVFSNSQRREDTPTVESIDHKDDSEQAPSPQR